MAKFCMKCGTMLDVETALCPKCDADELNRRKRKPRFCMMCGSPLDEKSGLCLQCDAEKIKAMAVPSAGEAPVAENVTPQEEVTAAEEVSAETEAEEKPAEEVSAPEEEKIEEKKEEKIEEKIEEEQKASSPEIAAAPVAEGNKGAFVAPSVTPTPENIPPLYTPPVYTPPAYTPAAEKKSAKMPAYEKPADYFAPTTFADMPDKKPAKKPAKKKKKASALEVLVTVILSFSLFVTAFLALASFTARNSVSKNSIEVILEDVDGSDVIDLLYMGSSNIFYRRINEYLDSSIDEKDFDKFINRSSAKEEIAQLAETYIEDYIDEDDNFKFDSEDVRHFLMRNNDHFEEATGVWLNYEQAAKISEWMIGEKAEKTIKNFSADTIKDDNATIYGAVRIGLSEGLFISFVVLSLIWIAAMAKNNLSQAAIGTGIVFIIIGGLLTVAGIAASYIPSLWEMIPFNGFVGALVGGFLKLNLGTFASLLISGIAMLIIRAVTIKIVEKVREKKAVRTSR